MNRKVKLGLYVVFAIGMIWFAVLAVGQYQALEESSADAPSRLTDITEIETPVDAEAAEQRSKTRGKMVSYGLGAVTFTILFAILAGIDIASRIGDKAVDFVFNDDLKGVYDEDYDKAEQEWAKGNHIEAIDLLRAYLKKNPRQIHAQLRIAEIYEKEMLNFLASALEYEDVLTKPIPRKRWGWAAIHLCNLYTGKLNRVEDAITLLRKIATDYSETPAAEKARVRLEQLGYDVPAPAAPQAAEQDSSLPPGFGPKK